MSRVRVRRLDVDAVVVRLEQWAGEVGGRVEVERVVLFGSLIEGTWSASSDADVVVIVDRHPSCGDSEYRPRGSLGIGLDLFVRTPAELDAMGTRFGAALARGRVLYQRAA